MPDIGRGLEGLGLSRDDVSDLPGDDDQALDGQALGVLREGRVPEFLGEPTETQRLQLAALVALRAGDLAEAAQQAAAAEAVRPHTPGQHNGTPFDDLRDVDDLRAGSVQVLTTTGKYYWIPTERLISVTIHAPKRPRDLLWRRASMSVDQGPDGDVYIPAVYAGDDTVTAISLFNNFAGAEEANKRALAWIEQELSPLLDGPASAIAGPVIVHTLA